MERSFSSPCNWRMLNVPASWLNLQSRHCSQLGEIVPCPESLLQDLWISDIPWRATKSWNAKLNRTVDWRIWNENIFFPDSNMAADTFFSISIFLLSWERNRKPVLLGLGSKRIAGWTTVWSLVGTEAWWKTNSLKLCITAGIEKHQ